MSKMINSRSHFSAGRGVFACEGCGRQTRGTPESLDAKCCSECYDLAGYENQFSDDGQERFSKTDVCNVVDLLAKIVALGGDAQAVRDDDWSGMYEFVDAYGHAEGELPAPAQPVAQDHLLNLCYNANGTVTLYVDGKKHDCYAKVSEASAAGTALGGHWGVIYDRTKK